MKTEGLSSWAIRKPIPTLVLFLALTVAGLLSFLRLPVNANPAVAFPIVTVTVGQDGAAPSEMESRITLKVEQAITGIARVRHIQSVVHRGVSETTIEFHLGTHPDRAANDVREAVAQLRADLPQGINEPVVARFDVEGGAILYYVVRAPNQTPLETSWFVDETIARELLALPGVQRVQRLGGTSREIRVALLPERLAALGITAAEVNDQLRVLNLDVPGGRSDIANHAQTIRLLGAATSVESLAARPIALSDGRWSRLSDIAEVSDGAAEARSFARYDNESVVGFTVFRAKGSSDTVVAASVAKKLEQISAQTPAVTIDEVASTVEYTQESYSAAVHTLLEGALLTVIVVFAFLRDWRATVIAAVAMPLSILPTFFAMDLLGFTLNSITLLALTLVIGVLVDDAIVEVENIHRHIHLGKRPYRAALDGADAIGLAVVATTLTIAAVFLPVSFIGGVVGQYFRQFGLTVAIAVMASLLVARLVSPLMAAYLLQPARTPTMAGTPAAGTATVSERRGRILTFYLRVLSWTLDHRGLALVMTAAILVGSVWLAALLPSGFLPASDSSISQIRVELPPGTALSETDQTTRDISTRLRARPEVAHVLVIATSVSEANIIVRLQPRGVRKLTRKAFEAEARALIAQVPDVRFSFLNDDGVRDVSIILTADNPTQLSEAARRLESEMRALSELANVQSTEPLPGPELQISPRFEEAARLGVSVDTIGTMTRVATVGDSDAHLAKFNLNNRQVPIRVTLHSDARANPETLNQLQVATHDGSAIPLTSVADLGFGSGDAKIERLDRKRRIAVEADLNGVPLGMALEAVAALPARQNLPAGVSEVPYGDAKYMDEMFSSFALAMVTGILLMLAVLILLFKDFLQPITIVFALPLSLGGAFLALWCYGAALDLSSTIGILMLLGIVGKNAILLVDFVITRRSEGASRRGALIEAGRTRARPIIMTTLAMVAGMAPAALGLGADAGFRAPMAVAVIGGLIASTVLSLVIVPMVYTYLDDATVWLGSRLQRMTSVTREEIEASGPETERDRGLGRDTFTSGPASPPRFNGFAGLWTACAVCSALALYTPSSDAADLQSAYQAAARRDAPLQAAQYATAAAAERLAQAEAARLPNVGAAVEASHNQVVTDIARRAPYNSQFGGVTLSLPIYRPENRAAIDEAKAAERLARSQLAQVEQDLITRVATAYFDALAADDAVAVAQAQQEALAQQFTTAKRNFEVGTVTLTDQQEAQAQLDLNAAQLVAAQNDRTACLTALETLTGSDPSPLHPLRRDATLPGHVAQDLATFASRASTNSFAVQQAQLATHVARHQLDQARFASHPKLDFKVEAGMSHGVNPIRGPYNERARFVGAGLALSIPLYSGGSLPAREREAAAQLNRSQAELENVRRQTQQAARQAHLNMTSALQQANALQAAVRSNQLALDSNRRGYQVGVRININVLNAQQQWSDARRRLSRARYDVLVNALELKAIAGELQPSDITATNALLAEPR